MRTLAHQLGRFAHGVSIETRGRWHAWRLDRHRTLVEVHQGALEQQLQDARHLLATR